MKLSVSISFRKIICLLALLSSCGSTPSALEKNQIERTAWEDSNIDSYVMIYRTTGFNNGGPWEITIVNGDVNDVKYLGDGENLLSLFSLTVETFLTVDDLFDDLDQQIKQSISDSNLSVTTDYNSTYHYPANAYFDWGQEGDGFVIESFYPL